MTQTPPDATSNMQQIDDRHYVAERVSDYSWSRYAGPFSGVCDGCCRWWGAVNCTRCLSVVCPAWERMQIETNQMMKLPLKKGKPSCHCTVLNIRSHYANVCYFSWAWATNRQACKQRTHKHANMSASFPAHQPFSSSVIIHRNRVLFKMRNVGMMFPTCSRCIHDYYKQYTDALFHCKQLLC